MWKGPGEHPGGESPPKAEESSRDLCDLKDQNEQQQVLIAQLKEMLRKSEQSNVSQEKVEEYVQTMSKVSARAKKAKLKAGESGKSGETVRSVTTTSNVKLDILRQQLEENKAKMAERGKSQKGIEDMLTQLQAQFNDSQQLINQSSLSISFTDKLEYSKNSSSEELYNILLTRERRISDMSGKIQRLEGNILSLQEDLKGKDSVINARTTALTLMTGNLSEKGKNTLDALEETKQQMRKMQQDFVQLEEEMKARQLKLLEDLKLKNREITKLQETVSQYQSNIQRKVLEINQLSTHIEELKSIAKDTTDSSTVDISKLRLLLEGQISDNDKLQQTISNLEKNFRESRKEIYNLEQKLNESSVDNELVKLKKQLEDSNKNMIKVKAQHKSKVKELNKKLEDFRKISDANAHIVQLQSENSKLSQRVAELEEEKGNMQLKMVESVEDTSKVDVEELNELKIKITSYEKDLEEGNNKIMSLENETIELKEKNDILNEELKKMSHWENVQVTAEMATIHLEEQLDNLDSQNKSLKKVIEELKIEKEVLEEKMEIMKIENKEINNKLESYIQENMELIDKIEKLSAEKVSSAESIEIVEGLTQQEKLELAAYQQTVDIAPENLKGSEENLDQQVELNESVMQLSEDSTELLHKIEMFNNERREVMEKMELLKEENNQLNLKLKEVENNHDVLEETYEQLQNEREMLLSEKEELSNRLEVLEKGAQKIEIVQEQETILELEGKLSVLQIQCENLLKENDDLKRLIKQLNESIHEKDLISEELNSAKHQINQLEDEVKSNVAKLTEYEGIIADSKHQLISSASQLNELQSRLSEKEEDLKTKTADIEHLNNVIVDLNDVIAKLEAENSDTTHFDNVESQMTEMKSILTEQLEQVQQYETELENNHDVIADLNRKLEELNNKLLETENSLEVKDHQIKVLESDLGNKSLLIESLQAAIEEKDNNFHKVNTEMREKYLSLQEQQNGKLQELATKNKELMEKMKKIAANLKKKNQSCHELEEALLAEKEKRDKTEQQILSLQEQLAELETENQSLQVSVRNFTRTSSEKSLQQELSVSCGSRENFETGEMETSFSKLQELEMIIETQDAELMRYRERVNKLEEGISNIEERRLSLERKNEELGEKLQETSESCQEKSRAEDELEERFAALATHDEIIMKRLEEVIAENQQLSSTNQELRHQTDKLKHKLEIAQEKVTELSSQGAILEELESTNINIRKQVAVLETDLKHVKNEYENYVKRNKSDWDKAENDWQSQIEEVLQTKNCLTARSEKLEDELKDYKERENNLLAEINELKRKVEYYTENEKELQNDIGEQIIELDQYQKLIVKLQLSLKEANSNSSEIEVLRYQVKNLKESLTETLNKLTSSETEVSTLRRKMDEIRKELLSKTAEHAIDSVLNQAQSVVTNMLHQNEPSKLEIVQKDQQSVTVSSTEEPSTSEISRKEEPITNVFTGGNKDAGIPTFQWSTSPFQSDPFEFVVNNQQSVVEAQTPQTFSQPVQEEIFVAQSFENSQTQYAVTDNSTKEELLQKIKALECMLYNIEKEKNDIELQCQELTNELTRLVYQKEKTNQQTIQVSGSLGSQILSELDAAQPSQQQELKKLEYSQTNPEGFTSHTQPVAEEPIQTKDAYLCFKPLEQLEVDSQVLKDADITITPAVQQELKLLEYSQTNPEGFIVHTRPVAEDPVQTKDAYLCYQPVEPAEVNSQVLQGADLAITSAVQQELRHLEYSQTNPDGFRERTQPVNEQAPGAKDAYLCYKPAVPSQVGATAIDTFGENDDGWGWNPDEAKLEEEHIQKSEAPQIIQQLSDKIRAYEMERNNHLEEIKQLQIKSGKLIKKCKELKLKLDKVNSQPSTKSESDFFSLDDTIQEEFKAQIKQLETKLKETKAELDKERQEKSAGLKKIDVLTSANERLIDMKEIQDIEVLNWQRKHNDILSKLQQYEWGDDGFAGEERKPQQAQVMSGSNGDDLMIKIDELEGIIKDLSLDNEELQALLEEQRTLRLNAEKSKPPTEKMVPENQFLLLMKEKEVIEQNLALLLDEKKKLEESMVSESEFLALTKEKEEVERQFKFILEEKKKLDQETVPKTKFLTLLKENEELEQQVASILKEKNNLEGQIVAMEKEHSIKVEHLISEKQRLEEALNSDKIEKDSFMDDVNRLTEEVQRLTVVLEKASNENLDKQAQLENLRSEQNKNSETDVELSHYKVQLEELLKEKETLTAQIQDRTQEVATLKAFLDSEKSEVQRFQSLTSELTAENSSITELVKIKEEEIANIQKVLANKDTELEQTVATITEKWEEQVNQRGTDVAESWKVHLETVETEFNTLATQLRQQVTELEERCNALAEENNELKRNIDTANKTEIDKTIGLQQEISSLEKRLNDTEHQLKQRETEVTQLQNNAALLADQIIQLQRELQERGHRIEGLNGVIDATQKQFEEKRDVVESVVKILERNAQGNVSYEKDNIINELQRQILLVLERDAEFWELKKGIEDSQVKLATLQQEREIIQQDTVNYLTSLEDYRNKLDYIQEFSSNLENSLQEKNQQVEYLSEQLKLTEKLRNDNNKDVTSLENEITQCKEEYKNLQKSFQESQQQIFDISEQFNEKCSQLEYVNKQLQIYQQNLQIKDTEYSNLKMYLDEKEREYTTTIENVSSQNKLVINQQYQEIETLKNQLRDLENHYEELISNKQTDVETVKLQLNESLSHLNITQTEVERYRSETEALQQKAAQYGDLSAKVQELTTAVDEKEKQIEDLQHMIEEQVLKIEELKAEILEKSKNYDSLVAEMDMNKTAITSQPVPSEPVTTFPDIASKPKAPATDLDDMSEPVSRAELDLALYMLHQRDVRCEELTVELTQLLEERDTLQLRLSNAIREKEELRRKYAPAASSSTPSPESTPSLPHGKAAAILLAASGTELAKEPLHTEQSLATKLSELKSIGYKRDKTLVDEQEARRIQQLSIMQQHINEASKLPPEAAARLVDATYTLSRDVQSPSKVLLNWFWGRSTPKVNDT